MTTTVTVNAHCNPETTHVCVSINDGDHLEEDVIILQDGKSMDFYVYGDREIKVCEEAK